MTVYTNCYALLTATFPFSCTEKCGKFVIILTFDSIFSCTHETLESISHPVLQLINL